MCVRVDVPAPEAVVHTAHKPRQLGVTDASTAPDPLSSFRGCPLQPAPAYPVSERSSGGMLQQHLRLFVELGAGEPVDEGPRPTFNVPPTKRQVE
jgi:hypothetical protein